jgi:transcription elongation GreA/GreB family factor
MPDRLIVTQPSLQTLAETLDRHAAEKMQAQREAKVAKEWGDLSENAEYKASKEKFRLAGRLQQRMVRELKGLESAGYIIVDPLEWPRRTTVITVVEVGLVARISQNHCAEDYLIVGAKDQHLPTDRTLVPLPYTSPLGTLLFGRTAPQHLEAAIAGELRKLELISLRTPTLEEVLDFYPELTPQQEK